MTLLITVTLLTLGISALCSLFEAVLYSTPIGSIEAAKNESENGKGIADRMLELKTNIAVPITAILVLNTIANTAGAALAGFISRTELTPLGVASFAVFLVLGILFLSELIPKTIGAIYWRRLWQWIVWPIIILRAALYPIVWVVQRFTNMITRGASAAAVTEEEIVAMVNLGESGGNLSEEEGEMVRNIIHLEDKSAKDIMTPRVVAFSLDAEIEVHDAIGRLSSVGFSRIPIYKEHPENISGYVLRRHLYSVDPENRTKRIQSLAKPISFVPETANCLTLLNQFLKHRWHIAMVADEYGGLAGLITLEDLIETLLGSEIVDETDRFVDMRTAARQQSQAKTRRKSKPGPEST